MKIIQFPRWAEVLGASDLPQKDRESYKVTLRWYLGWCHRNSVGCHVQSARDFIEWAQAEKNANEWLLDRWREPIRWFFEMAKAQAYGKAETLKADVGLPEMAKQNLKGVTVESRSGSVGAEERDLGAESPGVGVVATAREPRKRLRLTT